MPDLRLREERAQYIHARVTRRHMMARSKHFRPCSHGAARRNTTLRGTRPLGAAQHPSRTSERDQHSDRHAPGIIKSTNCVQWFDDSLNSAIHATYHSWLCSSSMHKPRDPPLKVICTHFVRTQQEHSYTVRREVKKVKRPGNGTSRDNFQKESDLHTPSTHLRTAAVHLPLVCKVPRAFRMQGCTTTLRSTRDAMIILLQVHLRTPCYDFYFL